MAFEQYVGANDPLDRLGLMLLQSHVHMREVEDHKVEIVALPAPDLEFVLVRDLGEHADGSGACSTGFRIGSGKFEMDDIVEIDAAVRRARIKDKISPDAVN